MPQRYRAIVSAARWADAVIRIAEGILTHSHRETDDGSVGVCVIHLMNTAEFAGNPSYSIPPYSS